MGGRSIWLKKGLDRLRRFSSRAFLAIAVAMSIGAAQQSVDRERAAFLKVHNDARAEVGIAPLQWNDKLAAFAQEWANEIARSGKFEHRPNNRYGENLAGYTADESPAYGARLWLDEKKDYHGEKIGGGNFKKVGHYTQMVWGKTTHVGYGVARMRNGMWVLVANYEPPGNMQGEHPYRR